MIVIDHLAKAYGPKQVLQDIHLTLSPGKVYGIVGENGAGKTTLFRCIAGLETAYTGQIRSDLQPLKNHLGFLPTNPIFLPKITGKEYLTLLSIARKTPLPDFNVQNIFDLPLDEFAENYSTGMKKKLALLGILLQQNTYFILDEPFNGIDIQSNMLVTAIIHQLKKLGKTILISSHIFSTLNDTCDEIHLLREGTFTRRVLPGDFAQLNEEMKQVMVGNRLDALDLR